MQEPYFIFDLDATVTQTQLLPFLARLIGMEEKSAQIAEQTRRGLLPFEESFRLQAELLRQLPIEQVQRQMQMAPLNERLADWIFAHRESCFLATELPDVWVEPLLPRLGLEGRCFSSKTVIKDGYIEQISYYLRKEEIPVHFPAPVIAVGNGAGGAEMLRLAQMGVGFATLCPVSDAVRDCADCLVFDEDQLCSLLDHLSRSQNALLSTGLSAGQLSLVQ